jgi:hypothetical protein
MLLTRRRFLAVSGAALASAAGVGLYAWQVEPHWVELVARPMLLEHLPPALVGKTLLHVSDIHVGPRVSPAYLMETLDRACDLAPDFVAFSGDFVTYRTATEYAALARVLRHMPNGRLGSVAVLGNHDYGVGWRQMEVADTVTRVAGDAGMRVLRNEVAVIGGLQFAGLADVWSPEFRIGARGAVGSITPGLPTVVLSHNPDVQDLPMWDDVRAWVLAGHTHGGQVKPPFLPPPVLPVQNKRYTSGEFDLGRGRRMYINRGLGYLVQVRFNARPELTLFTLQRAV